MPDDELMDQLLKRAMTADAPQLSPAFDARVMARVRPRGLTSTGRVLVAAYALIAAGTAVWFMRDLPMPSILGAVAITVMVASGARAYARRLAVDHWGDDRKSA